MKYLEAITTKYLVPTVLFAGLFTWIVLEYIIYKGWNDVDTMNKFADTYFKIILPLGAAIWALNRYFIHRTDNVQLAVDSDVSKVTSDQFSDDLALLVFRLDIINTGNTLIDQFQQRLQVEAVSPLKDGLQYELLHSWPSEGTHPGGPIEPKSWSAINDAIPISKSIVAVRFLLIIELANQASWTWHKTFDLTKKETPATRKQLTSKTP
jgi:hypothetical protein